MRTLKKLKWVVTGPQKITISSIPYQFRVTCISRYIDGYLAFLVCLRGILFVGDNKWMFCSLQIENSSKWYRIRKLYVTCILSYEINYFYKWLYEQIWNIMNWCFLCMYFIRVHIRKDSMANQDRWIRLTELEQGFIDDNEHHYLGISLLH